MSDRERPSRASAWETLGAWLRIWTPPRDVEVPALSRRRVAAAALVVGAVVVVIVLVAAPRIDDSKRSYRAQQARADVLAARRAAARTRFVQRPVAGHLRAGAGAAALATSVERAITADVRQRVATGELTFPAQVTHCTPLPADPAPVRRGHAAYDCLARTRVIPRDADDRQAGEIGYVFRAILDLRRGSWTFCKVDLVPGERLVPDPRTIVPLPDACVR